LRVILLHVGHVNEDMYVGRQVVCFKLYYIDL